MPTPSDVRATFLAENPNVEVDSVFPGEGDSDNVYFHIRYRLHGIAELHQATWLYQRGSDGRWQRALPAESEGSGSLQPNKALQQTRRLFSS